MIKMEIEKIITCENRLTMRCRNYKIDYNPNHHPNNLDCEAYKEVVMRTFEVKK